MIPLPPPNDEERQESEWTRPYRSDYCLWALISSLMFFPLVATQTIAEKQFTLGKLWRDRSEYFILAIGCIVVGWVIQAAFVMGGFRLSGKKPSDQASDYDDLSVNRHPEQPVKKSDLDVNRG